MKIIEIGQPKAAEGRFSNVNRSLGNLIPSQAKTAQTAQETVITLFKKILDNRFFLLQGVHFQAFEGLTPLVLIGPPGIWVIEASPVSGIFRASGGSWEEMDAKARIFRPAKPNLPARTVAAAKSLETFLAAARESPAPVEAVVVFTHPGAHLELQQPITRLIQADAMGRFAAGLLKSPIVLEKEVIQALADRLSQSPGNLALEEPDELAEFGDLDTSQGSAQLPHLPNIPEEEPELVKRVSRFARFNRFQWMVLGLLLVLNIFVLIAVILVVLLIT